jgi:hypothetical protein
MDEHLLHAASARIGLGHLDGGAFVEAVFWEAQPVHGAFGLPEDPNGQVEYACEAGELVALVAGEGLLLFAAVLEGAGGDDDLVDILHGDAGASYEGGDGRERDAGLDVGEVELEG